MSQKISRKIGEGKQKKVLSLVLCVAMMLSVMVVGAGAAFSDQSKIKNTEAVDACTALNIIGGYPDGSFKPEGNITRAEVTKMICVALNGGKNPAVSTNTTPTFSDVRNNANAAWAEGYIESCAAQGIVSGVGGGKFAPNGNVTGVQLAKMLLVSLGYNSDNEGFTGNAWATNVNVRAAQKGLYEGLETMDTAAAITRDNAAQMVWNALNAYEVEYKTTLTTDKNGQLTSQIVVQDKVSGVNGKTKITLLEDKYEADTAIGTFAGNSDVTGCKDGDIRITNATINGAGDDTYTFKYDLDLKYLGEEVKVLYKDHKDGVDGKLDDKDTIYGVYVTGTTTVYNITKNDLQNQKENGTVRFGDKNYDVASVKKDVEYLNVNYGASKTTAKTNMNANAVAKAFTDLKATSADTIKFVCNDDGDIVKAYVVTYKIARVTGVNSEKVSINNGVGTIKIADNNIYKDIAKDDIVVVSTLYNSKATDAAAYNVVTKATEVQGKLTSYSSKKISVDGTSYNLVADAAGTAQLATTSVDSDFVTSFDNQINETVKAYVINGIVYAAEMVTEATQYAVVEDSDGTSTSSTFNPLKIKMMKADGTEATVEIHKDSIDNAKDRTNYLKTGAVIKYSDVSNGKIKITEISAPVAATSDQSKFYNEDNKTFNGKVVSADAVLFVNKTSTPATAGDFYKYTARNVKSIDLKRGDCYATIMDDGKVVAAYVTLASKPSGASSDTVYGIVSSANGTVKVGDDTYTSWTVQVDGDRANDKTVLIEGTSSYLDEGYLVSFDVASDNVYSQSDVTIYLKNANTDLQKPSTMAAIYEYDAKGEIISYWDTLSKIGNKDELITKALDKDVKIIYVNTEDDLAAENTGAIEYDAVKNTKNAYIVFEDNNSTKNVVAIFVDVDGDITK